MESFIYANTQIFHPQYAQHYADVIGDIKMIIGSLYTEGSENHIGERDAFKRITYNTRRISQILQPWRM